MKRIFAVLAVVALMATMMVVSAMPAFAFANPDNNGKAEDAPGQDRASDNCGTFLTLASPEGTGVVGRQATSNSPSNGHQENATTPTAPTNCNHFFN
jgi:hypothetical protein